MSIPSLFVFSIAAIFSFELHATYDEEVGASLGMAMVTVTENDSGLEGENVSQAESVGISPISANIYWKFLPLEGKSFYFTASIPMVAIGSGDNYFNANIGFEYYFSDMAHRYLYKTKELEVKITPKWRYFVFSELGVSYVSYTTETAKKNDTFFEAGGGGGLFYKVSQDWSLKGSVGAMMGRGVISSPMVIKLFLGGTFFLD